MRNELWLVAISLLILFVVIYFSEGSTSIVNGHQYVKVGIYSTVHDPDCPCHKNKEK
jgi:hypothetical protein